MGKIKSAAKKLEKIKQDLGETDGAADTADKLKETQVVFHEIVMGLLELSFPVDEAISTSDFKEEAAISSALERMHALPDLTDRLGRLFALGKVKPPQMARTGDDDALAPQVLKMLEKSMKKEKKKEKEKKKAGGNSGETSGPVPDLKKAKEAWESTD